MKGKCLLLITIKIISFFNSEQLSQRMSATARGEHCYCSNLVIDNEVTILQWLKLKHANISVCVALA